ncbi:DNA polymerase III subunit delta' C-terminal domain-containing protein [Buchnera aphidicola]|uniref:DNA polymerase III subunit delta' n=1 Tax=Buchnera aphidicola str. USDA (Myzus persicae) TaxID=1009856 RepID=W0NZX5_BUCMP|nr:DNA polymerase III subunit delta' C-terminal domain-containing protein [Buchnera aphidicola]AHG60034.1 Holb [Buchnera aphidicola str. USDA (Myzus persicae)]AHG60614.1 Holb [Buchnera aphidicola str. W106 (Myzus persicae)]AHG61186.1 Holb [Buchnera aphidicola str. G002 (Myzus persicae)]AHG61759.1 Holb [Buchnera aphidicola str. F009 (Myzus persicae)]WAI03282.1 MAG: DNA polymerase III subunit delta' [Buchnera aphidicola (Myzus persicae)]
MKLYPWLLKPYNNIIQQYQIKKAHHAILIKTSKGMGVSKLIWFISKWILCLDPIGTNFCNKCHGCKLMSIQNHPDWHYCKSKNNDLFNIDEMRIINEKIFKCSQQGGSKIIFFPDTEKLTESAVNAFLKTLEEPPNNTWFFLVNYNNLSLHYTLNSRCLIYKLFVPNEKDSLTWLKKSTKKKDKSCLTSLRINQGSPIYAKKFINSQIWIERINFYKCLFHACQNRNLLKILPILNNKNSIVYINWICFLLLDSIKFSFNQKEYLTNLDQIELIEFFSDNYKTIILDVSIRTWMKCRYRLLNISGINHELLLLEQLLKWEKILNFIFKI